MIAGRLLVYQEGIISLITLVRFQFPPPLKFSELSEWFNVPVLKTGEEETPPWVRQICLEQIWSIRRMKTMDGFHQSHTRCQF